MSQTRQRAVVITGASSGIGRASAQLLARNGFTVFAGVRKPSDGDRLRSEGGVNVVPLLLDVTDADQVASAAERLERELDEGGLDGLVNNAGVGLSAPLEYVPLEQVRQLFQVNLFGQLAVTQAMLPFLRRTHGRIVNVGSVGAHIAIPFGGVLGATKSALTAFNDSLRLELHPFGLHVCLIEPASISTPAVDKMLGAPETTIGAMPRDGATRYGEMLQSFTRRAYDREKHGSPPEVVAHAVLEALTAARPRHRYLVGKHALSLMALSKLPGRLRDHLELRLLGLPAGFGVLSAVRR